MRRVLRFTMKKILISRLSLLTALIFLVILDQTTKTIIVNNLPLLDELRVFEYLNIVLVYNRGAAFGIFSDGFLWQKIFLVFIPIGITIVISYVIFSKTNANYFKLGLTLILAGALGNLIDRIRLGYVVDFIDFHVGDLHWPAFNVADFVINIGAALIIFLEIKILIKKRKAQDRNGN